MARRLDPHLANRPPAMDEETRRLEIIKNAKDSPEYAAIMELMEAQIRESFGAFINESDDAAALQHRHAARALISIIDQCDSLAGLYDRQNFIRSMVAEKLNDSERFRSAMDKAQFSEHPALRQMVKEMGAQDRGA